MIIKEILNKPFSKEEKFNFVCEANAHNYKIKETETQLQAWGYTAEEQAEKERERLDMLSLTKREVFLALYRDKGITPEQLRAQIQSTETLIEFDYANDYFRGNPLINSIGAMLGYTSEQLDYLFEHKEFEKESEE